MKRFPHIISKLFYEPVLITPQKHGAICQVVEAHMTGHLAASSDDKPEDYEDDVMAVGSTLVIPVYGVIDNHIPDTPSGGGGCDLQDVNQAITMAENDPSINRVVFDFRTPGGSVNGVPETASRILELSATKETVGFTDSECCSGGIWLASQCEKFYSTQSASVGSVGVWCAYLDISRQMQNEGVNMQAFFAGKHKLIGAYWKPLTDDEKAIIQKSVDKIYAQFKTAMVAQREVPDEGFGNGLVFDGEEAAQLGFTDGVIGSLDELLEMEVEPR